MLVQEMSDGGMGSLYFPTCRGSERHLGGTLLEAEFVDRDGILVSAIVNLDNSGDLLELDIWKVNFSKLLAFPRAEDVRIKARTSPGG